MSGIALYPADLIDGLLQTLIVVLNYLLIRLVGAQRSHQIDHRLRCVNVGSFDEALSHLEAFVDPCRSCESLILLVQTELAAAFTNQPIRRSEERRVGQEGRLRRAGYPYSAKRVPR